MRLLLRILLGLCAAIVLLIVVGWVVLWRLPDPGPKVAVVAPSTTSSGPAPPSIAPLQLEPPLTLPASPAPALTTVGCDSPPARAAAAADNAQSVASRDWSPWGRPERGWEIYLPLVAQEIGSGCAVGTPGFADALARWQAGRNLTADGIMTPPTFEAMRVIWLRRRPFVIAFSKGQCPGAADEATLAAAKPEEGYSRKPISLRPAALAAYRAMLEAARREVAEVAAAPQLLTIFSGYRAPAADEARCDEDQSCGALTRARCSAHRTGLAVDLYLGAAPGSRPESTDDANRLFLSRSAAYRWLVANGSRFGFVNYPFEPWHWEWTGEPIAPR